VTSVPLQLLTVSALPFYLPLLPPPTVGPHLSLSSVSSSLIWTMPPSASFSFRLNRFTSASCLEPASLTVACYSR
jgi:hypothetical protein